MTEDNMAENEGRPFQELEPLGKTLIAPAHAIAAVALNMAIKYHDIATVQDGTLYQQYKMEGRNLRELHLNDVFETAILMEMHLLGSSERIAKMLIEAIEVRVEDDSSPDNAAT